MKNHGIRHIYTEKVTELLKLGLSEGIKMFICDLSNNPDFILNAPFRILCRRSGGETITVFDSDISGDMPFDLMFKTVAAISSGDDEILEIEYAD